MSKKNGQGVDILAKAMRRVFKEEGVEPLREDVGGRPNNRIPTGPAPGQAATKEVKRGLQHEK